MKIARYRGPVLYVLPFFALFALGSECNPDPPEGDLDGGVDGGELDGGQHDAGDAGQLDGGASDGGDDIPGGNPDGGLGDGGFNDAGVDGGADAGAGLVDDQSF